MSKQKTVPGKPNPMKPMMMFMPIMIGGFSYTLPTALSIYWTTSNLLTLAQTYLTHRKMD